ncbi:MAG: ABC transporter ATP-binding protein [Rhizobiales bacterium NRL2]|jgi:peptide/nickel transport system ATP-binding protein|nr:MAG: ABC transporter ATP-binding protein [Rhizobiales bacterium NRL2]
MTEPKDPVPILSVEGLSVDFKTRGGVVHAVRGVDFELFRGETLGVVGESGSGKSVTAFNIMGILEASGRVAAGHVRFRGLDLTTASERALREIRGREASMIFQNPRVALNPIRTVGDQIEDVLRRHTTIHSLDLKKKAIEALDAVRIRNPELRYSAYPFELSGGMCQRVMIALALACDPQLLIADEPTTGLDVTTQKTIMDLIRDLGRERNLATVLITHDLGLASQYCQRLVVMKSGEVVEAAATLELFANPQHPYTRKLIKATPRLDSRLEDLSDEPAASRPSPVAAPPAADGPPLLAVENLVKEFSAASGDGWWRRLAGRATDETPPFRAVDDVSFEVCAGESVGLVGESGCGKSTTSNMITRLMDPTAGRILFEGHDLAAIPSADFALRPERRLIQMVFQDPTESLNPRFNARSCIADPLMRLDGMRNAAEREARIVELAGMVGLPEDLLGRFPHQLSGGQKARVGIARAIAVAPKLLILDEPTSALDVSVQAIVLKLLADLKRRLGMSYLFVSHDLNVVRLLCDRVIVMNAGRIVEQGPAEEILSNPKDDYTRALIEAVPHLEMDSAAAKARLAEEVS